jgi:hypothetical protein
MSRVYFHSEHGEATITGRERGHLCLMGERFGANTLRPLTLAAAERLASLVDPDHYLAPHGRPGVDWGAQFLDAIAPALLGVPLRWADRGFDAGTLVRNSAIRQGGDQIKLAVRIQSQCEIHAWVDGLNRAWLAGIIRAGIERGLYREDQGWPEVIELLLARDDEPVVTSSSFCDQFPNPDAAAWQQPAMPDGWIPDGYTPAEFAAANPEPGEAALEWWRDMASEQFEAMPLAEQWRLGMGGLRADADSWLELTPDRWETFYFRHGLDLQDLLADDYADRLDRALADHRDEGEA